MVGVVFGEGGEEVLGLGGLGCFPLTQPIQQLLITIRQYSIPQLRQLIRRQTSHILHFLSGNIIYQLPYSIGEG